MVTHLSSYLLAESADVTGSIENTHAIVENGIPVRKEFYEQGNKAKAAAKGVPMVLIDAVAGCEADNLNYYVRLGGAVTADSPEELAQLSIKLLQKEGHLTQMKMTLAALPHRNAAHMICKTMCADEKAGVL